jgi:hypothetical protein
MPLSGTEPISPGESGKDVTRIGGIFFQLSPQSCDVCVDSSAAYRRASTPHLAQELDPRGDGPTTPHQGQQEPELGAGDLHRLTTAKNRPCCWLQENASELDRSREATRSAGGEPASSLQQLLDPSDQLPHNRDITMSSAVARAMSRSASAIPILLRRHVYLELVNDGMDFRISLDCADVLCGGGVIEGAELEAGLLLVVDDENSRNASIVHDSAAASAANGSGSGQVMCVAATGMSDATPTATELLDGYDRTGLRGEKQIRSGMLLSIPEVRDLGYEPKAPG